MTPAQVAEWLNVPTADEWAVDALADVPVPSTDAEQIAAFRVYLSAVPLPPGALMTGEVTRSEPLPAPDFWDESATPIYFQPLPGTDELEIRNTMGTDNTTRIIRDGSAREQIDAGLIEVDPGVIHDACNGNGCKDCNRGWNNE